MTQEEKYLLLIDLCARLPYSTLCYCKWTKDTPNDTNGCIQEVSTYLLEELMIIADRNYECQICEIKPYLRPMSSVTEEERKEVENLIKENRPSPYGIINNKGIDNLLFSVSVTSGVLNDWLNAHHFDYRGLIEKGLAIEVTEENNPYRE